MAVSKKKAKVETVETLMESPGNYITVETLAGLLKVSPRRVQQLRTEGAVVTEKTPKGPRYHLIKSLLAFIAHQKEKVDMQDLKERSQKADTRYRESKALLYEMECRKRKGELHEAKHVEKLMNDMITGALGAVRAVPGRVAHDVLLCKTESEISACILSGIDFALREYAQKPYDADAFRALVEEEGGYIDLMNEDEK